MYTEIPRHMSLTLYDPDPDWTTEEILEYERITDDAFEYFQELERQEQARERLQRRLKRYLIPVRRHWRRPKFFYPKARQDKLILLLDRISREDWAENWVRPGYEDWVL